MMSEDNDAIKDFSSDNLLDAVQLRRAVNDICDDGALGRSKVYAKLLRYLAEASISGKFPKEIEIAIDVLERDEGFDVTKDSAVRVYVHQLRKRLDSYYAKKENQHVVRITIPKGQYNIELDSSTRSVSNDEKDQLGVALEPSFKKTQSKISKTTALLSAAIFLLFANITLWFIQNNLGQEELGENNKVASHPFWSLILADDIPVMIVVGDYYIFGEQDKAGNIKRMVREFSVNSKDDLETLIVENPELAWRYSDLDLSYIPEGAAFAMNSVLPIVNTNNKSTSMKMMSELTIQDLQNHHVVYLGYVSGLNRLARMIFTASGLRVGENFDELVDKSSEKRFVSDAGLPSENRPFIDYGFVSSIPTVNKNRLIVISGMRDAGLKQMSKLLADYNELLQIPDSLFDSETSGSEKTAFELLYEVRGMDRMSFSSRLVYENKIDSNLIWRAEDLQ